MHARMICAALGFVTLFVSCNQTFDPDGPTRSNLVLYSILSSQRDTQYVELSATYWPPDSGQVTNATVELQTATGTISFHDTTIQVAGDDGATTPVNMYVAYHASITGGASYTLIASVPSGLSASSSITTLVPPTIALTNAKSLKLNQSLPIVLNTSFSSVSGAYVLHFYIDFYALVDNGWELHRTEVPSGSYSDDNGNTVLEYPSFTRIATLSTPKAVQLTCDTLQYSAARARILKQYGNTSVVWLNATFVMMQIDDPLYDYYYVTNGPIDASGIHLDQTDFTNISGGYGVFGSSTMVTKQYSLQ